MVGLGVVLEAPPLDALHHVHEVTVALRVLVARPADLFEGMGVVPLVGVAVRDSERLCLPLVLARRLVEEQLGLHTTQLESPLRRGPSTVEPPLLQLPRFEQVSVVGDRVGLQDSVFLLGGSRRGHDVEIDVAELDPERPPLRAPLPLVVLLEERLEESQRLLRCVLGLVELRHDDDVHVRALVALGPHGGVASVASLEKVADQDRLKVLVRVQPVSQRLVTRLEVVTHCGRRTDILQERLEVSFQDHLGPRGPLHRGSLDAAARTTVGRSHRARIRSRTRTAPTCRALHVAVR